MSRLNAYLLAALFLAAAQIAAAQVPETISYQGYLTDAEDAPMEAAVDLTFRLYDAATGGSALWTETQSEVAVAEGVFNVLLGSVESLSDLSFGQPLWLSVAVGDAAAEELDPRVALAAVPYSFSTRSIGFPFTATADASSAPAFEVRNTGSRSTANFVVDNNSNFNSAILASTNGIGATIFARTFGLGRAGLFRIDNNNNTNPAVEIVSSASEAGSLALLVNHSGSQPDADIAIFQSGGTNVARIDKDGTGYFNGGTQASGADVAEAFDVEGSPAAYEPGDVLVISTNSDRRVTRTSEPYSKLVIGVYATKPGVLLTERSIGEDLSDQIPMGVVGVVPTKVTGENGPIRRGDLLVTSGLAGHAMKGTDQSRMLGAVIGKALENFDGPGTGAIQVMVNVQ